jgi:glycosyltransferase involved in cell wall biosynthesis
MKTVSVAIICHNYGHYLREAVDSVLAQTLLPCEVVIVDDASTDDTEAVAKSYAARGVRYVRVDTGNVWLNRLRIIDQLRGKWVLCLDADNTIPPTYLESALTIASHEQRCGVVYPSLARFGDDARFVDFSAPRLPLSAANYIDASSVFRRESILQADLTDCCPSSNETAEDWILARRVLSAGWTAHHNPTPLNYRVHGANKHAGDKSRNYYDDAGLEFEPVTIIVPLSGRLQTWPRLVDWLDWQSWPAHQCRIVLIDNSHNPEFEVVVKRWMANTDYGDVRYLRSEIGRAGMADEKRTGRPEHDRDVHRTVAAIYNRAFTESSTDYVLTLEDDIEPPLDVIERLLRAMLPNVAAVTGAYKHRNGQHWLTWHGHAKSREFDRVKGSGVQRIDGAGFGCLLLRRLVANSLRLTTDGPQPFYDQNAFVDIAAMGWRCVVDWDAECIHHAGVL